HRVPQQGHHLGRGRRQYTGISGKIDNCQISVSPPTPPPPGRALVDRELYLPKAWTSDREPCRAAKVPDEQGFATARNIVRRCLAGGLPATWATEDKAHGQDWHFRRLLEQLDVGYVVAVPKSRQIKSLDAHDGDALGGAPGGGAVRKSAQVAVVSSGTRPGSSARRSARWTTRRGPSAPTGRFSISKYPACDNGFCEPSRRACATRRDEVTGGTNVPVAEAAGAPSAKEVVSTFGGERSGSAAPCTQ
ncbi:transposase, partial [Streptomyces flaveolus]